MQIFVTLVLAFVLAFIIFKLIGLLLGFVFSVFLGIVRLAFVVACALCVVYFAIYFLPLL